MVLRYRQDVNFVALVQVEDDQMRMAQKFKRKYDLGIPVQLDLRGEIAASLGVYATPQAVLIDEAGKVFYKGNYNSTRYCTSKTTAFANIALQAFVDGKTAPLFPELAFTAYGCELPSNTQGKAKTIWDLF